MNKIVSAYIKTLVFQEYYGDSNTVKCDRVIDFVEDPTPDNSGLSFFRAVNDDSIWTNSSAIELNLAYCDDILL